MGTVESVKNLISDPVKPQLPSTSQNNQVKGNAMSYIREEVDSEITFWAMMCHLSSFAGVIAPIPFINLIAPLIIWMVKKDEHPFIDDNGREVLNFQISLAIYSAIGLVIGLPMLLVLWIGDIVATIKAALCARDGYLYEYPITIRFL